MRVAVIGTGRMGRGFAAALAPTHHVVVGSRDRARAAATAAKVGAAGGATYRRAAADADVVILTVPWEAMEETLRRLGDLDGTIVVDISFPYRKAEREALERSLSSTAEEVQRLVPKARVCKGWNHVHARHLTDPEVDGIAASVLIAGDDPSAKEALFELARDMGFHPVDVGALKETRQLERLVGTMFFVKLGPLRILRD